ncbi:hypothetical protein PV04_01903 [Phialophora macrospora]|uniref:Uncharacterized protein n=1 Tax=Phialophora macrospora TaxID=1851006 RepID=A0A0D2FZ44_9EURO|nr:hypothetical protein PV04_01903 [Phialophora macrospora]
MDSILGLNVNLSLSLLPILLLATPGPVTPLHKHLALTGTGITDAGGAGLASYLSDCLSVLTLCLGLQTALDPSTLNGGEYPACAALTTGYLFRVENAATVAFLQQITRTGSLTRLEVRSTSPSPSPSSSSSGGWFGFRGRLVSSVACLPTVALLLVLLLLLSKPRLLSPSSTGAEVSVSAAVLLSASLLLLSRLFATISFCARTRRPSWHGAPEPGVAGDLLVLLSEDRWARVTGLVDDLKAVTSGRWLARRPAHPLVMDCLDWMAGMMVWVAVVVLGGASDQEKGALVGAVLVGHWILMFENARAGELVMNGRTVRVAKRKKYARRLELAEELIKEVGRSDFAVRLGMINPEQVKDLGKGDGDETRNEVVTM